MFRYMALLLALSLQLVFALKPTKELAVLNVTVQNEMGALLPGETIIFKAVHKQKDYSAKSDRNGQLSLHLPKGEAYDIYVVSLGDDPTHCGELKIPLTAGVGNWTVTYENSTYTLKNVLFDTGKATLQAVSSVELDKVARNLNREENININFEVAGHTDNVGGEAFNIELSQARAESVRSYLIGKGVKASRLQAQGYGYSQPVASNANEAGRAQNRRTELRRLDE